MVTGQCLCGAHRFELEGPFEFNHHCHCGHCRKQHGSAFASLVGVAADRLRWQRGEVIAYRTSPDFVRESCATCGTPLPQEVVGLPRFVPAGCLDDVDASMQFHIFVASMVPWYEIRDGLPTFDAFPPGVESAVLETRPALDPPGGTRGSCLCGEVRYVVDGPGLTARHCHCQRCRRGRGAAHASNWVVAAEDFRWTHGEATVRRFKVPDARFFTQCFCEACGATVPTVDVERKIAVVPLGGLDDAPPISPREHIWTASIPGWSGVYDGLPRLEGPPVG